MSRVRFWIRMWVIFHVILWLVAGCSRPEEPKLDLEIDPATTDSDMAEVVKILDSMCIDPEGKVMNYQWFENHGGSNE